MITAQSRLGHSSITAQVTAQSRLAVTILVTVSSQWAHGEQSRWPFFFSWVVFADYYPSYRTSGQLHMPCWHVFQRKVIFYILQTKFIILAVLRGSLSHLSVQLFNGLNSNRRIYEVTMIFTIAYNKTDLIMWHEYITLKWRHMSAMLSQVMGNLVVV